MRDRGADAGEEHAGGDEAGHEEVDVGDRAGVDRAAEHVAEDQQEQAPCTVPITISCGVLR